MTIHSADIIQPSECVVHSRRPGENSHTRCREELESKHIFGAAVELLNLFFFFKTFDCANQNLRDSCTRGGSTRRCKQVLITLKETKERACVDLIWTFPQRNRCVTRRREFWCLSTKERFLLLKKKQNQNIKYAHRHPPETRATFLFLAQLQERKPRNKKRW